MSADLKRFFISDKISEITCLLSYFREDKNIISTGREKELVCEGPCLSSSFITLVP